MKELFLAVLTFAILGGGVVFGIRYREQAKEVADMRPSIANFAPVNLPENVSKDSMDDMAKDDAPTKEDAAPAKPDAPASLVVKVLNGGAVGGSAGKMVSYLKQNGYAKAETGNANGANKGVVIYFSVDMADEAKVLQLLLLKQYQGVEAKPVAEAKIPEAKTAPMVVVLGS